MPRDLRNVSDSHDAMTEALRNAPKLGRFVNPSKRQREKDVRILRIVFFLTIITIPTIAYLSWRFYP